MAASPNRSPSPITGRRNPISRTPESGNSIRKSLGGYPLAKPSIAAPRSFNPITPANSPSDFPHRNLSFKEGTRASYEQKENERDQSSLNLSKVKSPLISKGAKNFMAPTISAASKFTPSPRKKVLAERNEAVRSSLSIPDGKSPLPISEIEENRLKFEVGLDSPVGLDTPNISQILPKPKTAYFDPKEDLGSSSLPVQTSLEFSKTEKIGSKTVKGLDDSHPVSDSPKIPEILSKPRTTDLESKEDLGSSSVPGLDPHQLSDTPKAPETQNPCSLPVSTSPDVDPSLPPYDPKTNYLSPRPRFLHYRPNPRIEVYLNRENREGKNLDNSFTSESSSDSDPIEEETQSPEAETDSADSVSSESKAENATEFHVLEPKLDKCNAHDEVLEEEESIVVKEIPQKSARSSARPKFMSFLLALAIVCVSVSVTDSPAIPSSSLFRDHPLAKTYAPEFRISADGFLRDSFAGIAEFTSANLEWVSDHLGLWSMNSISYLARKIYAPREGGLGVIHFMNLTALDTDISINKLLADVNQMKAIGENKEKNSSQELEVEGETQHGMEEELGVVLSENVEEEPHLSESETHETVHEKVVMGEPSEVIPQEQEDQISHDLMTKDGIAEAEKIEKKSDYNCHADIVKAEEIEEKGNSKTQADVVEAEEIMEAEEIKEKGDSNVHSDIVEAEEIEGKVDSNSHADFEPTNVEISAQNSHSDPDYGTRDGLEAINTTIGVLTDDFTMQIVLGISSILVTLAVAAASLYFKKSKASIPKAEILEKPLSPPKKMTSDSASASTASSNSHPNEDGPLFYKNWPAVVDMAGESGPLEMSNSLEDSLSTTQHGSDRGETKSVETKLRRNSNRDSMVSTSEYSAGSPSYGSFTTYEKLHKGSGDDDAMTPVRRSSRLRKQITSP